MYQSQLTTLLAVSELNLNLDDLEPVFGAAWAGTVLW